MKLTNLGALIALTCQIGAGCIFNQEELPSPAKDPKVDMKGAPDMHMVEEMTPPPPDMTSPGCQSTAPDEQCCGGILVKISEDAEHCGACEQSCGEGNRCVQGACTCETGAQPQIVAKGIPSGARIFLLPSLIPERILSNNPNATSFPEVFSADMSLLTYYAVTYEPGQSTVRVLGLNGRGEPLPGLDSTLNPRPSDVKFTIKNLLVNQDFMGNLVMIVHFDDDSGSSSELKTYRVVRKPSGGFSLLEDQEILLNSAGGKIHTIGTNKNVLDGIAVVYIAETGAQGSVLEGLVIDPGGSLQLESVNIGPLVKWPEGTELQVALSEGSLAVSWWRPNLLDGPLTPNQSGDFEHVIFERHTEKFKAIQGLKKYGSTRYLNRGLELPRSQPMFLFNSEQKLNWAYYQVTQAQGASTVEVWSSVAQASAQSIAKPTLAFGQDWSLQITERLFLEFSWVEGASLEELPISGGLHYASWGLDLNKKEPPVLRQPAPLSAKKTGYRNVRTAFGTPRTMGYLGHYAQGNDPGELHFYITRDDKLVCQPRRLNESAP